MAMSNRKKLVLALTETSVGVQYEENGTRGLVETYDIQEIRKADGPIKATIVVAMEREVATEEDTDGDSEH